MTDMPSEHTEGLLRIGEVARLFNLSVGTLRHYEQMGLLDPAHIDPASGYRYYGSRQLSTLNTISHLRVLDLPLAQIREFVTTRDVNLMQRQLAQQQKLIERKRRELERVSRKIDNRLALLHNALNIELDTICTIDAPELRCAVLRERVNPTDAYAQERENGQLGKTEMWYVLDASKDAKLVYGLKRERTEQQMRDAIAKGTLMKDLQWVPVKKDDLFFIEAGTIHAIGAGALVAEIQENSNLTYRLYDYDRVGKDGKKRELHIDKALDVANLKSSAEPKQPLRVLKYRQGIASELLTRCKYFEVYRMIVNTERRQKVHYRADEIAFRVLLCVNGCGTIAYQGGTIPFYKGDCIFVPADSELLTIHGQAQFLDVRG